MARIPTLEVQIANMKRLLRTMCDRVYASLLVVEQHLQVADVEALVKVVALDSEVDRMETELDDTVLRVFATQQPRAQELRLVYATAKIAHHIERMGDAVESLARQLAGAELGESRTVLLEMISHVKDLFFRSYAAMFEEDLAGIQDIFDLDDAVDACQGTVIALAKEMFLTAPREPLAVERGLKLINIASKLEKIADLCCNWAEQTDFAAHGFARRVLKKRRLRLVLCDSSAGRIAASGASFLLRELKEGVDVTVATIDGASAGREPQDLHAPAGPLEQVSHPFPIVRLDMVSWSRCFLLVNLGRPLQSSERERIPGKTMVIEWNLAGESAESVQQTLQMRLSGLLSILARSDVSN
ncbi:MAG: hypothetical protein RIR26_2870 [Pseudomonadota bacterium]